MTTPFRGITAREGVLVQGSVGWGDFCPFVEYDDQTAVQWLATAVEAATEGWPSPVRDRVPVNAIVPAVGAERAHQIVREAGCATAKVKVADGADSLADDIARVEAVRDALGPDGNLRIDANGSWDVDSAVANIRALDRAAGGLEYVEQPCHALDELVAVRRRVDVPVAADESIRGAEDPMRVALAGAADIAIIKCSPLGGVLRSLEVADASGLPCVVSSAVETSVGLASQLALAAALPELTYACGLGTLSLLTDDVVDVGASLRPKDGCLSVPSVRPSPDLEKVATLQPNTVRTQWWIDRLERAYRLLLTK